MSLFGHLILFIIFLTHFCTNSCQVLGGCRLPALSLLRLYYLLMCDFRIVCMIYFYDRLVILTFLAYAYCDSSRRVYLACDLYLWMILAYDDLF